MRPASSLSRRSALLIVIVSPVLLGTFKCVFVSNPTVATARIEQIEPTTPRVGDVMRATGSGNGAPPLQFAWDFGDGTSAAGAQAAHVYAAPGSYRLTLRVRDASGHVASDSSLVDVSARISLAFRLVLVSSAIAGQPVLFEALPLEESASPPSYVWTFSDGQSATGPWTAATFASPGIYIASVAVTDDRGAIAVAQLTFRVADTPTS
jgi:chitodextrinase